MSDETRNNEIRDCWFERLLEILIEMNESTETDAECELMELIAHTIQENVHLEPKGDSDE